MNINNWPMNRKLIAILGILFVIAGIAVTIFIVQKRQNLRVKAEKSTILSLTPVTQNVENDGSASLDLNINPGVNQVNFIKIALEYDKDRFNVLANQFTLDPQSNMRIIKGPVVGEGSFLVVLETGNDPTKVIRNAQKLGKLDLQVKPTAPTGASEVKFNFMQTQVRSIEAADPFTENVLSSVNPATIIISAVCRENVSTCSWDKLDGASKYKYKITNVTDGVTVSEGETSDNLINFTSVAEKNYKCEVSALNTCGGAGETESATNTCILPSKSPTTAPSRVPSKTPTSIPTKAPTTARATATPTPTKAPTTATVTATPTLIAETFSSVTPTDVEEISAEQTLPPTGNPFVVGGIIGAVLVIIGGLVILIL